MSQIKSALSFPKHWVYIRDVHRAADEVIHSATPNHFGETCVLNRGHVSWAEAGLFPYWGIVEDEGDGIKGSYPAIQHVCGLLLITNKCYSIWIFNIFCHIQCYSFVSVIYTQAFTSKNPHLIMLRLFLYSSISVTSLRKSNMFISNTLKW